MSTDLYSMPGHIQSAIDMVESVRVRLAQAMVTAPRYSPAQAKAAGVLAQAVKALSSEARLWANQLREHAATASLDERTAAAVRFLIELPPGPRDVAYRALSEAEATAVNPLQLAYTPAPDA